MRLTWAPTAKIKRASETIGNPVKACAISSRRPFNAEKGPGSSPGPSAPHKHQRLRPERPGVSDRRAIAWPVPDAEWLSRTRLRS